MLKIKVTNQKLINTVKTISCFKRKVFILFSLIAATAFGARRVTTSKGNLPEHFDESSQTSTKHCTSQQKFLSMLEISLVTRLSLVHRSSKMNYGSQCHDMNPTIFGKAFCCIGFGQ